MRHRTLSQRLMQTTHVRGLGQSTLALLALAGTAITPITVQAAPVPGYVAPVTQEYAPDYVDDTRGVFIPTHAQQRLKTESELARWGAPGVRGPQPYYAQSNPQGQGYERQLNTVANGVADADSELDRIAQDPGLLSGGRSSADADLYAADPGVTSGLSQSSQGYQLAQASPATRGTQLDQFPSLATGGQPRVAAPTGGMDLAPASRAANDDGQEIAIGGAARSPVTGQTIDMQNGIVRLKEERIAIRRAVQRMMDQIGGGSWTVVWDLEEQNAGLPDMEVSLYAEEPFINVLNAMLGRLQSRSGQPLRVVRYDKTQRLVITDRASGESRTGTGIGAGPAGKGADVAVTETVLKESVVSLHYDEVPLVDALENIINQAGKGQWRLRMYAGTDQVLKPAHIEEPFGVAVERILKVFNLRYEVFPGGKLIVVTSGDRFGFRGVQ